jgi:hypothetical protein
VLDTDQNWVNSSGDVRYIYLVNSEFPALPEDGQTSK